MSSITSSPVPWQVVETISDSATEWNSALESPVISDYRETLSGRWGGVFDIPKISGKGARAI
ncbi:hypothetical protein B9Z19DRAFT_1135482 [Tuber borchii]|uniref:Uncharacterized protein n=1 Tax=Tuber borchii TaxID=42251 RepID=A0A2T6ZCV4_TUBBO|nr:hypothetical protein B9Z19DRAFT_1135482 [Tuber borchii]